MNNTSILKKCITELESESPKLDYIRGMLETLYEMQEVSYVDKMPPTALTTDNVPLKMGIEVPAPMDEGALLDSKAKGALASVKAMAEASTEMS